MLGLGGGIARSRPVKTGFQPIFGRRPTQIATDIGSEMTLDNRPLTAPAASEQQASLASLPEDLEDSDRRRAAPTAAPRPPRTPPSSRTTRTLSDTQRPFRNPPPHDPTPSPRPVASTQDGFLVGGASLKPEICEIVKEIAVAKNTFAMGGA